MRVKTWKILDRGEVPSGAPSLEFDCQCGRSAMLPAIGLPLAQMGAGIVFDIGRHALPALIQCRKCGRVLELRS